MKLFEEYISDNIFDIENIPIQVLDKAYVDFSGTYDFSNPYNTIEESGIAIQEDVSLASSDDPICTETVVYDLEHQLNLQDFQFKVKEPNGVKFIEARKALEERPKYENLTSSMLIPAINENEKILTELMDARGYYKSREYVHKDRKSRKWLVLVYDPKKQESIKEMVTDCYRYAYHTTPVYNVESIADNDILSQYSAYPFNTNSKRVFLYLGMTTNKVYTDMMESISRNIKRKNRDFDGTFVEYEIELSKLPKETEFYADVHGFGKEFIYVNIDVPTNAITRMKKITY